MPHHTTKHIHAKPFTGSFKCSRVRRMHKMEQANKCSASQEATTTETPKIDNYAVTILRKSRAPGGRSNSIVVFGVDFEVTKNLQWRVVCAQRLAALFSLMMIFAFGFQNNQLYRI